MVPKILQTDRIPTDTEEYIKKLELNDRKDVNKFKIDDSLHLKTTTCEGATVYLDCMIFWMIVDTDLASRAMSFV